MRGQNKVFGLKDNATIEELDVMFEALMTKKYKIVGASNPIRKKVIKAVSAPQYGILKKRVEIRKNTSQKEGTVQAIPI